MWSEVVPNGTMRLSLSWRVRISAVCCMAPGHAPEATNLTRFHNELQITRKRTREIAVIVSAAQHLAAAACDEHFTFHCFQSTPNSFLHTHAVSRAQFFKAEQEDEVRLLHGIVHLPLWFEQETAWARLT